MGGAVRRAGASAVIAASLTLLLAAPQAASAAVPSGAVFVVEVSGEIDLGLSSLVERAVREAEEASAALLVVRVDTPGGRVDAALRTRSALLSAQVPTVAFVDREALSAGALIALSADEVWFAPGGVMGAAAPAYSDGRAADEKTVSALRAVFRATAAERLRDPTVAEAMVDPAVVVPGLSEAGSLVTLDIGSAREYGYVDGVADDVDGLLAASGFSGSMVVRVDAAPAERIARVLTGPLVAGLLLSVGVWLLMNDLLRNGGLGVGSLVGLSALGLFLFGHSLAGLAGRESFVLMGLGLALLAVEVLVLPGFGLAGVSGMLALVVGAALALYDPSSELLPAEAFFRALNSVSLSLAAAVLLTFGWLWLLGRSTVEGSRLRGSPLVLSSGLPDAPSGRIPSGTLGVAVTPLRPAGVGSFGGSRVDVVAEGRFVPEGSELVVVSDEGYRCVVRRAEAG